jgi:stage III sporulation protein AE
MTVSVSLFTGFLSLKCTVGSTTDAFTSKTVKFMVSGFIPVIGSAISDAYTTVKGSLDVIRCTAGVAGTIAAVLIMLPPVIEVLAFRMVMWIANTAAGMFSLTSLEKLFKSLDAGLAIAFSILVCFTIFFIISTGILIKSMA